MALPPFSSVTPKATFSTLGKLLQTVYNVMDPAYGAKGNGTTDDTAAINSALTAAHTNGGTVYIPSKTFLISAPLVINSNTALVLDPNATINLAANSNCNMLVDTAHHVGSGSVSNIYVRGGIWNRGSGNNVTTSNVAHNIVLGGEGVIIEDVQIESASGKYAILFQNIKDFYCNGVFLNQCFSDGVHIQGPAVRGTIKNIRGYSIDDTVAITPIDIPSYVWGNEGDVHDILIDNVQQDNKILASIVKVLSGKNGSTVLNTSRIVINNISATTGSGISEAIYIGDDGTSANTENGQINDVTINNVNVPMPSASVPIINIVGFSTSLQIPYISIRNVNANTDAQAVVKNAGKVNTLIVDGVAGTTAANAMTGTVYLDSGTSTALINRLFLSNIDVTNTGTQGGSLVVATASGHTLGEVYAANIAFKNYSSFVNLDTTTTIYTANTHAISNANRITAGSAAAISLNYTPTVLFDTQTDSITSGGAVTVVNTNFLYGGGDPVGSLTAMTGGGYLGLSGSTGKMMLVASSAALIDFNNTSTNPQTGYEGRIFYSVGSHYMFFGVQNNEQMRVTTTGLGINTTSTPDKLSISGNLNLVTAGNKLKITTGSNASAGTGTLSGGTVTISTTAVTANSLIFLTDTNSSLTNVGTLAVTAKSAGTSFTVTSSNASDSSTFNWLIIN